MNKQSLDKHDCHCGLWRSNPAFLHSRGLSEGYCGICQDCSKPGHTRTHPALPTSGEWCDDCYHKLARQSGLRRLDTWVSIAVLVLSLAIIYSALRNFFD